MAQTTPSPKIGLAVLGAGRIGAVHANNAAREVHAAALLAVADIDLAAAQRVIDRAGAGRATIDYHEVLVDPRIDGVIIAMPTHMHAEVIKDAARAGKHIFCEKPITLTLESTRAAIDTAHQHGVLLQIGFNRRFDRPHELARQAILRGDIGEPWIIKLVGRDPRLPTMEYLRQSGGIFKDQAIHEFDIARWLMGREVTEVYATGSVLVEPALTDIPDVDTALTTLRFEGGALGLVDNCRRAIYGYDVRAEIHGSNGKLTVGCEGQTAVTLLQPNRASHDHVDWFIDRFAGAFRAELADFVDCIKAGRQPRAGAEDGYRALQIAVGAGRSLVERRPVQLSEVTRG